MKIVEINMMHSGSTGKIMFGIADVARNSGHEVWTFSPRYYQRHEKAVFPEISRHFYFGFPFENMLHLRLAQFTGLHGCFSILGTLQLLRMLEQVQPDVVHLHNLHNWTVNLPILFNYLNKKRIRTIWTLHDCWAFTGKCVYFTFARCEKWKNGCFSCPKLHEYPKTFIDRSRMMWNLKKKWITSLDELTVVTPSQWLASLAGNSYLKKYPIHVIHNGIDLNVFKPTPNHFREENSIGGKYIVLAVSFGWGRRKGFDVLIELAKRLPKDTYQIVVVGTNNYDDQLLPSNVISIHQIQDQRELAKIYTAADVFINPTREENYPTVNMEAIACGTPVVTFDTGGSPEILNKNTGVVIPYNDIDAMEKEVIRICKEKPYTLKDCLDRAKSFNMNLCFSNYVHLYEEMNREDFK